MAQSAAPLLAANCVAPAEALARGGRRAGTARKLGSETPRRTPRRQRTGSRARVLDTHLNQHVDTQRHLDTRQRAQRRIERIQRSRAPGLSSVTVALAVSPTVAAEPTPEGTRVATNGDRCGRDDAATGAEPTTRCAAAHPHPPSQSLTNGAGTLAARPRRCRAESRARTRVQTSERLISRCAELRAEASPAGHPLAQTIHQADRWVAATAVVLGLELIAGDGIFEKVPGLDIVQYGFGDISRLLLEHRLSRTSSGSG